MRREVKRKGRKEIKGNRDERRKGDEKRKFFKILNL